MKRLVIALFLLILTAGLCLKARLELDSAVEGLLPELEKIEAACKAGDLDTCIRLSEEFAAAFEERTRRLPLFLPHAALDSAAGSAALLPVLARADPAELPGEICRCRDRLMQMAQTERITWQTVF